MEHFFRYNNPHRPMSRRRLVRTPGRAPQRFLGGQSTAGFHEELLAGQDRWRLEEKKKLVLQSAFKWSQTNKTSKPFQRHPVLLSQTYQRCGSVHLLMDSNSFSPTTPLSNTHVYQKNAFPKCPWSIVIETIQALSLKRRKHSKTMAITFD